MNAGVASCLSGSRRSRTTIPAICCLWPRSASAPLIDSRHWSRRKSSNGSAAASTRAEHFGADSTLEPRAQSLRAETQDAAKRLALTRACRAGGVYSARMPSRKLLALSVYVLSPGDVDSERRIAIGKLLSLQRRGAFAGKLTVTIKAWDEQEDPVPMVATEEAQETVNTFKGKPEECDLTIVILAVVAARLEHRSRWPGARIGHGVGIDNAARAAKPVWVYWRTQTPLVPLGDEASLLEANRQYRALKDFLGNLRTPHGKPVHINRYADDAAFERHLGAVLEGWARRRLMPRSTATRTRKGGRPGPRSHPTTTICVP